MKYSPKDIKMAIGVASDKRYAGGNMTGAVKAIEKIKKGLSSHPQVAAVLKRQNESKTKTFDELRAELAEGKAANPAQQAAIAIAKKEKEKSVKERTEADCEGMVCKNCGDKFGMPTEAKCMYDSKDPNGKNWMEKVDEAKSQMATLKKEFEPLRGKKINPDAQKKLSTIMKKLDKDKDTLIQLVKADIPFVTQLAMTKLITKHNMKAPEIKKLKEEFTMDDFAENNALELDEAQKLFMFTSKAEAQKKAKQIGGKVLELKRAMDGNMFAVIHKDLTKKAFKEKTLDEGIIGKLVKKTAKAAGGAVVNRLTTSGRAKIAQKKLDKHKTNQDQKADIAKANAAGKSAFGFTQKQRAANAKKKMDKIAKKKSDQETIQRAKDLKKKPPVTAGMEYEGKGMDSAAMKRAMDAFKKRGGKIKKVAPGKAAGYHGKDDPGADIQGMMDRGDTKGFNRKKKVKSMGK
jgi:hypothetical protein